MDKHGLFISDVKLNVRLRDFFLDFLACIVPGLIFVMLVTILVVGIFCIFSFEFLPAFTWKTPQYEQIIKDILVSCQVNKVG